MWVLHHCTTAFLRQIIGQKSNFNIINSFQVIKNLNDPFVQVRLFEKVKTVIDTFLK